MIIYLLLGYFTASISAFFICYVACVAAAAADQRQAQPHPHFRNELTLYHSLRYEGRVPTVVLHRCSME